jgi:hypothetical protein
MKGNLNMFTANTDLTLPPISNTATISQKKNSFWTKIIEALGRSLTQFDAHFVDARLMDEEVQRAKYEHFSRSGFYLQGPFF